MTYYRSHVVSGEITQ